MENQHKLSIKKLIAYRERTFATQPGNRLKSPGDALEFVNHRGFILFWPIKGIEFPSLWTACAGNRPVADDHDDPGHVTWRWKDDSLGRKNWYYAKVLRKKGSFISLKMLPYFYALSPNYGTPEQDYLMDYEEGKLTLESKLILETLIKEGPLDTLTLKKAARMSNESVSSKFEKAITDLQSEFKVVPSGIAEVGAWKYAYIYDLTHRQFPLLINQSHAIKESQARHQIMLSYFTSLGAGSLGDFRKFFPWAEVDLSRTVKRLVDDHILFDHVSITDMEGEIFALTSLWH